MSPELRRLCNQTGVVDTGCVTQMSLLGRTAHFPSCWESGQQTALSHQPSTGTVSDAGHCPTQCTPPCGTTSPSSPAEETLRNHLTSESSKGSTKTLMDSPDPIARPCFSSSFPSCQGKSTPTPMGSLNLTPCQPVTIRGPTCSW